MHTYEIVVTETTVNFLVDGKVVGSFGAADMPYDTWTTGDMKGFTNLWCVDPSLSSWAGEWVYPGTPLAATVAAIDVRPGDLGIFEPVPDLSIYGDGAANDLFGTDGDDLIYGQSGDDTISGRGGNDVLEGEGGNDVLDGGSGADQLLGGEGNDVLRLDGGDDLLDGGNGIDWIRMSGATAVSIDLAKTTAQATGYGTDTIRNIENVESGWGADTIRGNGSDNVLSGRNGNDRIEAGMGSDTVIGGMGSDALHGGLGRDTFVFNDIAESSRGKKADLIHDFVSGIDDIDLSGIDARQSGRPGFCVHRHIGRRLLGLVRHRTVGGNRARGGEWRQASGLRVPLGRREHTYGE